MKAVFTATCLLVLVVCQVKGHGRLVNPPSRATAWRYNFNTPKNYNDHELYCGGWSRQHQRNRGQCGVCGDPWDLPVPRPNEGGGAYSTGTIVRTYSQNSTMEIGVELTANHNGFFEFRLCPQNDPNKPESDDCFNRNLLQRADGQGARYFPGPGSGIVFTAIYLLPEDVSCNQCVLQWRYVAGNNWGTCENGTSNVGCGPQEEFRACADIKITPAGAVDDVASTTTSTTTSTSRTTLKPAMSTTRSTPRFTFRTRGTSTTRITKTTTTPTTTTTSSTATTTEASTTATTSTTTTTLPLTTTTTTTSTTPATTNDTTMFVPQDSHPVPGPYIGIIIALASLLFAILFILGIVVYFYQGHDALKKFIKKHKPTKKSRKSLQLPSSVLETFNHSLVINSVKPSVAAAQTPRREPRPISVRQLSIIISEPIDVTINGVPVIRNNSPTEDSTA